MSRIIWDKTQERLYEIGVNHGVLYPKRSNSGAAWNGLVSVSENSSGGEITNVYANNGKYAHLISEEEAELTIEAYSYPNEFDRCLGRGSAIPGLSIGGQHKEHFGLCYRTEIESDKAGGISAYKLHILYDCIATLSQMDTDTINDSPEADVFSFDVKANKVTCDGFKPTASLTLDSREFYDGGGVAVLKAIEDILYGTDETDPRLPTIAEIKRLVVPGEYLIDENGEFILDSDENKIEAVV